jgi:RNA polymerase sigma-70 factor (ECF subfamily)
LEPDFADLYRQFAPGVYRYLVRVCGSRLTAQDLLQETFLRLHLQLRQRAAITCPRPWLYRVAVHLARDHQRASQRAALRDGRYARDERIIDFQAAVERQDAVAHALARLTPRMRQVLLLFAEGFTYREIAEITGVECGYVGVLMQRARAAFRRHYEDQDDRRSRIHPRAVR